jgi:hypothetical protein
LIRPSPSARVLDPNLNTIFRDSAISLGMVMGVQCSTPSGPKSKPDKKGGPATTDNQPAAAPGGASPLAPPPLHKNACIWQTWSLGQSPKLREQKRVSVFVPLTPHPPVFVTASDKVYTKKTPPDVQDYRRGRTGRCRYEKTIYHSASLCEVGRTFISYKGFRYFF